MTHHIQIPDYLGWSVEKEKAVEYCMLYTESCQKLNIGVLTEIVWLQFLLIANCVIILHKNKVLSLNFILLYP